MPATKRGMQAEALRECPDCNRALPAPRHGSLAPFDARYRREPEMIRLHDIYHDVWHQRCECGVVMVWSFPNVWKRRHALPLFEASAR